MIYFENVYKIYDGQSQPVVNNISFAVGKGEILTLLGSSGAGKTTLLKMVNRLCEPSKGRVMLDGQDVNTFNPVELRRQIGYVSQSVGLFPHMTVEENITLVLRLQKKNKNFRKNRADELLELVGLNPSTYAKRFPDELSGGQQQRVAVAKALAANPEYLLMDEPFAALDPILRAELQTELLRLHKTLHKTILFVTHDISEALRLGNTIGIMHQGKLEQIGTAQALLDSPANVFVKNFMATGTGVK
ncbi:MAG: proV [Gammaproteobacteria bacterium]|jgi:osmoprotectant transport system ATP-binding protein|nr:proV [Gammaproteobacteria bacterium]